MSLVADRGDMHPDGTRTFRASIVVRSRFVEDLVEDHAASGVGQYVLLGAGLDTFVQRRPDLATGRGTAGRGYRPRSRPMISFMISVVPP